MTKNRLNSVEELDNFWNLAKCNCYTILVAILWRYLFSFPQDINQSPGKQTYHLATLRGNLYFTFDCIAVEEIIQARCTCVLNNLKEGPCQLLEPRQQHLFEIGQKKKSSEVEQQMSFGNYQIQNQLHDGMYQLLAIRESFNRRRHK